MAFYPNDIYTSSGNVMLFNSWTPYVSKFDTSTFYNWEQDNIPLYDLEERTYELWEQGGFATSAGVPGLALTVSADAPALTLDQNNNIFTDVSSAIAAIPKVVRFPVLIEVANFGDLGPLELHNFRIEENGSIEIINRNFGRAYNASSLATTVAAPSFNRSHDCPIVISSLDLSNTLTDTSCVHIGSKVFSGFKDSRLTEANFVLYPSHVQRRAPLSVVLKQSNPILSNSRYTTNVFETQVTDQTIDTLDISSQNTDTAQFMFRQGVETTGTGNNFVGGNFYGNACSKISVMNCDGPIYIRNFFVDAEQVQDAGIAVSNSKVLIENCAAVRAKKAGFKFSNSEITLSRSAFSYRNYQIVDTSGRADQGAGFHATNSDILVSSNILDFSSTSVGDAGAQGRDAAVVASRNGYGFILENSKLRGGVKRSSPADAATGGIICSELNTSAGIVLESSEIDVRGLIDVYGNNLGIQAKNSYINYENLTVDSSQNEGILAENSFFVFDSVAEQPNSDRQQLDFSGNLTHLDLRKSSDFGFKLRNSVPTVYGNSFFRTAFGGGPAIFAKDNSNVDLVKAYIDITDAAQAGRTVYGRAAKAINNSTVTFNGARNGATAIKGPTAYLAQRVMAAVCAENNSTLNFHGPTAICQVGVNVLAQNNSTINFEPRREKGLYLPDLSSFSLDDSRNHTTVELHSTRACVVANKNSVVNMKDLGAYSVNWPSTAFGVAALESVDYPLNLSSALSGGSMQFYANPQDAAVISTSGLATAPFTAPLVVQKTDQVNSMLVTRNLGTPNYADALQVGAGGMCVRAVEDSVVNVQNVHFPFPPNDSPADGIVYNSSGSLCNRFNIWNIADKSRMNASYLSLSGMHPASSPQHGPSALWASSDGLGGEVPASGAPLGTPDTGRLSILDAFGQGSAVWVPPSGVDINSPFDRFYPISGAGQLNPEAASSLSQAGINVSGADRLFWGVSGGYNNRGFFRIYWSPKGSARLLMNDLSGYTQGAYPHAGNFSGVLGTAYQVFAQGYNCSAPLSALPPVGYANASSVAPDLLKQSIELGQTGVYNQVWTSGFYYCSEMLDEDPTQCVLDESAADAFANAKNASIGLGGRPRKTTIYNAGRGRTSEAYGADNLGGFKSATIFDLSRDN
jgi:hypothetical protein